MKHPIWILISTLVLLLACIFGFILLSRQKPPGREDIEPHAVALLLKNEAVKVYAKLPGWFKVPTPLGTYNPDWAVLIEKDGTERLYFVVETKGSLFTDDLRDVESGKIKCGEAHFQALGVGENPARYLVATNIGDLWAKCG